MDGGEAADLAIFISCTTLLLAYSLLYFRVASFSLCGRRMMNLYALNKQTRKEWVVLLSQGERPGVGRADQQSSALACCFPTLPQPPGMPRRLSASLTRRAGAVHGTRA